MNRKGGITLIILTIAVIIMAILATVIVISTTSSIQQSKYTAWANEIKYIQEIVSENLNKNYFINETKGTIYLDITSGTSEQFEGETIVDSKIELLILDLDKLKIVNTVYGNMSTNDDVYALSVQTGRVYYVKGIELDGNMYYTLTSSLFDMFDIQNEDNNIKTVVFKPNKIGYTNEPITVTVRVPEMFLNVEVNTSNNSILVGQPELKDGIYEYQVNSNNIQENYIITVTYTVNENVITLQYKVNNYDTTKPVIYEDTSNEDIVSAVATDESGIKTIKYEYGIIAEENAKDYFAKGGKNFVVGKFKVVDGITEYTVFAEDNAGNFNVKHVHLNGVWQVVDGVPIPRGFVPSPYGANGDIAAENTKAGGMVIYQLTDDEIKNGTRQLPTEDQYVSWTTRNQYVWVPVDKNEFKTKFVRRNFGQSYVISNTLGENYWEVLLDEFNMPVDLGDSSAYISKESVQEAIAMYKSVAKHGGFYVARYEAGIDQKRGSVYEELIKGRDNVYSMMNKIPYTYIAWSNTIDPKDDVSGMVEVARSLYPKNDKKFGVVSTLIYGVQWDTTLQWFLDTGAVTDVINNTYMYGNYSNTLIYASELNDNAMRALYTGTDITEYAKVSSTETKWNGTVWLLSTGAYKKAKINNIYDMAGNLHERGMEAYIGTDRVYRGGYFAGTDSNYSLGGRFGAGQNGSAYSNGFRSALYIK